MDTEKKQLELDKRYIRMASIWAENSYCQRRKVGALIVKDKMINFPIAGIPFANRKMHMSATHNTDTQAHMKNRISIAFSAIFLLFMSFPHFSF